MARFAVDYMHHLTPVNVQYNWSYSAEADDAWNKHTAKMGQVNTAGHVFVLNLLSWPNILMGCKINPLHAITTRLF